MLVDNTQLMVKNKENGKKQFRIIGRNQKSNSLLAKIKYIFWGNMRMIKDKAFGGIFMMENTCIL